MHTTSITTNAGVNRLWHRTLQKQNHMLYSIGHSFVSKFRAHLSIGTQCDKHWYRKAQSSWYRKAQSSDDGQITRQLQRNSFCAPQTAVSDRSAAQPMAHRTSGFKARLQTPKIASTLSVSLPRRPRRNTAGHKIPEHEPGNQGATEAAERA